MTLPEQATRISPPRFPEKSAPFRFPYVASIAPIVIAIAIWLVTGSGFALMFAALGPVAAIATFVDSRVGSRRTQRREMVRFLADATAVRALILSAHGDHRDDLLASTPDAVTIAHRRGADPTRWMTSALEPVRVTLGLGATSSATQLERRERDAELAERVVRELDELEELAKTLDSAPIVADARSGIGICGPEILAISFARILAVQLSWSLSPAAFWCRVDGRLELSTLPHSSGGTPRHPAIVAEFGERGIDEPTVRIAISESVQLLPDSCRVVVELAGGSVAVTRHPDLRQSTSIVPAYLSREQVRSWSLVMARDAERDGLVATSATLALSADLTPMLGVVDDASRDTLACSVALSADGIFSIDLVRHGPHAVIGGTTGSGKSELLITWVLAMAAKYSPARVTFLLVDFKGGSAFEALARVPHVVGTVTDLDDSGALRALESLRAELRYRERVLVGVGARSIEDTNGLPRLVIIVDEFAAMMSQFPDLHALFTDVAARGRSLGVHLILCTQRPAGVVRDAVLANTDLRISLRVNNRADSVAVVGSETASEIPSGAMGRGVVQFAGATGQLVQFAIARDGDAALVAERWSEAPPQRRPWCEPLGTVVSPSILEGVADGFPFGITDVPSEQRRGIAVWRPATDGHLLVLGAQASGKSTALEAIAGTAQNSEWMPKDPDAAWDAVASLVDELEGSREGREVLVVCDDFDSLVSRLPPDYRSEFVERMARVLREGSSRGIRVALAAQRATPDLQSVLGLIPARLMLKHSSRNEFVLAGGDGASYLDRLPPGGGLWQGDRVQVVAAKVAPHAEPAPAESRLPADSTLAIVSTRLGALRKILDSRSDFSIVELATAGADWRDLATPPLSHRVVIVGDVDDWQSRWGAINSLRTVAEILFDGCTPAEFRVLTRSRELPPLVSPSNGLGTSPVFWRLEQDGSATRTRLPPPQ